MYENLKLERHLLDIGLFHRLLEAYSSALLKDAGEKRRYSRARFIKRLINMKEDIDLTCQERTQASGAGAAPAPPEQGRAAAHPRHVCAAGMPLS